MVLPDSSERWKLVRDYLRLVVVAARLDEFTS
jgi:hypothetical protein